MEDIAQLDIRLYYNGRMEHIDSVTIEGVDLAEARRIYKAAVDEVRSRYEHRSK